MVGLSPGCPAFMNPLAGARMISGVRQPVSVSEGELEEGSNTVSFVHPPNISRAVKQYLTICFITIDILGGRG